MRSRSKGRHASGDVASRLAVDTVTDYFESTAEQQPLTWPYKVDTEERADALFHALSDRTRRDIVRRSLAGEHSVSALAADYDMSFAAVQKHVSVLERAGLITKRRSGRQQLATGEVEAVRAVASMLAELELVWRGRITRIDDLLAADNPRQEN